MRVLLPLEIVNRELDGKIWLTLKLLEENHEVIIGKTPSILKSMDIFNPNIIFVFPRMFEENYFSDNTGTVSLDKEGGVFSSEEAYYNRITPEPTKSVHTFFAWGTKPAEIARSAGCNNVIVSGNPRFDLLRPSLSTIYDDEAKKINEEFGSFVLINTNFTRGNHHSGSPLRVPQKGEQINNDTDLDEFLVGQFVDAARDLAHVDKNLSVIIRPHPSENHETYTQFTENHDSLFTIHDGSVRPWIKASDVVIHNGCTTGIESSIMNVPTIAYCPERKTTSNLTKADLPNKVSMSEVDKDSLINTVSGYTSTDEEYELSESKRKLLAEYFHNVNEMSAPIIVNEISKMEGRHTNNFKPSIRERFKRLLTRVVGDRAMSKIRGSGIKKSWLYSNQKFSFMSTRELSSNINKFKDHIAFPAKEIQIRRIRRVENTFHISRI
jgi:surface carbohydrate biosynthesis protein